MDSHISNDLDEINWTHCPWCGDPLELGDLYNFHLEYGAWRNGGLLAPEDPDFDFGQEPVPTCKKCQKGIRDNREAIRQESNRTWPAPVNYIVSAILILLLLLPLLLCVIGVVSYGH